jgi:inorganic pyrophosphatase
LAQRVRNGQPERLLSVLQAACGLHGLAGCAAEKRFGSRGVLATDLCDYLGVAAGEAAAAYGQEGLGTGTQWPEPSPVTAAAAPVDDCAAAPASEPANPPVPEVFFAQPLHWSDSVTGDGKNACPADALGRMVTVTVDRKLGETHPEHKDIVYSINYGYVQDVLAEDNEWQDAYIYGETLPLDVFEGQVVAVIHRLDDVEDKWVVADPGTRLTREEVRAATLFVEKYFESEIYCL